MDHYYLPGAEPFYFRGGPVGCLVAHGLMSSPYEVKWLGESVAAQGMTVYGPRLAGHGTDYRDMRRTRWRDWHGSVLDGYHMLRAQCEWVVLVGHSTGGTLALLAASMLPVDAVAVLAAPVMLRGWVIRHSGWIQHLLPYINAPDTSDLPARLREAQRQRGEAELGRVRYDRWASRGPAELYTLTQTTQARLSRITAPLLAVYAVRDTVVDFANFELVTQGVGSNVVEKLVLQESEHNVMLDHERETVFAAVADFVKRNVQP